MLNRQQAQSDSVDRLESAGIDFFQRVRQGYHKIADNDKNRFKNSHYVIKSYIIFYLS